MASPFAAFEPLLASSKRVSRNVTTLQDLIAAYPSLKEKCLASPSTLTDSERRLLLDLPDVDTETTNIRAATNLSRVQLIEKAVSNRESLTSEEIVILRDRFWTPSSNQETSNIFNSYCEISDKTHEEFETSRKPAYAPNEQEALAIGGMEFWKRAQDVRNDEMRVKAQAALLDAPGWIQYLYRHEKPAWGFVYFYDAAAQKLSPERLDDFSAHLGAFYRHVLDWNGSKSIIDHKWQLISSDSPATAFAPTQSPVSDNDTDNEDITNYEDGAIFRNTFRENMRNPREKLGPESGITAGTSQAGKLENYVATSGILTNTFLVFDPICIDTVLGSGKWYDNMRVFAFEADFPVEGRKYEEGYQGYTLVRLDQILYNFYELRSMKADEVGMDKIWKAAQKSRNGAFVSMDADEALSYTTSCALSGFTRDSILGKR